MKMRTTYVILLMLPAALVPAGGQMWGTSDAGPSVATTPGPPSPCPGAFTYDPREAGADRWQGVVLMTTRIKMVGFTLEIRLDRPADLLGNWQGMVETEDNIRFSITSLTKKILPGPGVQLRIFVKYSARPVPKVVSIKLNGRKICPAAAVATTRTPPRGSAVVPVTSRPGAGSGGLIGLSIPGTTRRPAGAPAPPLGGTTRRPAGAPAPPLGGTTRRPAGAPVLPLGGPQGVPAVGAPAVVPISTPAPTSVANLKCGTVRSIPQVLITHGQGTEMGQWPWHVAVYKNAGKDLKYTCGGSLVGSKAVVTAAHCVALIPSDRPVAPDTLVLYFGKYHLLLWSDGGVQSKQIQQVVVHPSFNSSSLKFDIAVLVLKTPVDYTDYVRPICLWNPSQTGQLNIFGKEGTVVGWGFDETGQVSQELTMAKMPVVDHQTCIWSYPDFFSVFTNNMTFCAGFRNGTSVCNGDSGGGLVFPVRQRDNSTVWFLRGIVSLTPSKAEERVCDTRHYVVFTDVAKYLSWLSPYVSLK